MGIAAANTHNSPLFYQGSKDAKISQKLQSRTARLDFHLVDRPEKLQRTKVTVKPHFSYFGSV